MAKRNDLLEFLPFMGNIVEDKALNTRIYVRTILAQLTEMFEYDGLPESIPKKWMLLQLYTNGNIFVTDQTNGNGLMSFVGGWGGKRDGYYIPVEYIVANPYVNVEKTFTIGTDGILILNDSNGLGLLPIITRYCELLAENDISLRMASINSRRRTIASVPDDNTKLAFDKYLKDIVAGKMGSAITSDALIGELRASPDGDRSTGGEITSLIELQQYIRATMYHSIGLNANYNMKRESISSNESQLNKDALFPLVDNMLREQREGWDKVNEMFGTEITVRLSSAWKDNEKEKELDLEQLENDVENSNRVETPTEENSNEESGNGESEGREDEDEKTE